MLSVCVATFNGEKFILPQLKSILAQIGSDDEVVISDDGSNDNTLKIIAAIDDARIRLIKGGARLGYSSNFERALMNARGDVIFLSDQDDVWLDSRIEKMTYYLQSADMVVSNAEYVDQELKPMNVNLFQLRRGGASFISNLIKLRSIGACLAFRRVLLIKALPFPKNNVLCPHDMWLALLAAFYFRTIRINEPLILYRRHQGAISSGGFNSNNTIVLMLKFRLYALICVLGRWFK